MSSDVKFDEIPMFSFVSMDQCYQNRLVNLENIIFEAAHNLILQGVQRIQSGKMSVEVAESFMLAKAHYSLQVRLIQWRQR